MKVRLVEVPYFNMPLDYSKGAQLPSQARSPAGCRSQRGNMHVAESFLAGTLGEVVFDGKLKRNHPS